MRTALDTEISARAGECPGGIALGSCETGGWCETGGDDLLLPLRLASDPNGLPSSHIRNFPHPPSHRIQRRWGRLAQRSRSTPRASVSSRRSPIWPFALLSPTTFSAASI